jgi:hypothetical protein
MARPLMGAVEDFAVYVVLGLTGGGISPPDGSRLAVAAQFGVDLLVGNGPPVDVVHHPRRAVAFDRVKHPSQKPLTLLSRPIRRIAYTVNAASRTQVYR